MHLAALERQSSRRKSGFEDATEAPEVKRGGVPEITRRLPELEVLGMALDVCDDAVDVHVADLEQNAHGLRQAILLTPLQELRTSQCCDIRVAAAVDEDLAPDRLSA